MTMENTVRPLSPPEPEPIRIAVAGNPLDDLRLFQDPERLHLVMKAGVVYRQRL